MLFKCDIDVRYGETDKMGIVYHSRYFDWFEVARSEALKELQLSYSEIENLGILMPIIDCFCNFKRPARYGDRVVVETEVTSLGFAKCRFDYHVYNSSGILLAVGYTVSGFVDTNFKPINLKKTFPEVYSVLTKLRGESR